MNNKLIFLIPILLLIPSLSYAEIGFNFDTETSDNSNVVLWTSHYDRVWNGLEWVNYLSNQDSNIIRFDSANLSFEFNKLDCSFRLFDPLTNNISIEKYERTLKINNLEQALSICEIDNFITDIDGLVITTKQNAGGSELKTIYEIDAAGSSEWTYEITNNDLFTSKIFSIEESCINCQPQETKGDFIIFGNYILDTKNRDHNKLKQVEEGKDFKLIYEDSTKGFLEKTIIDPGFTSSNPSVDAMLSDTGNNDICDGNTLTKDTAGTITAVGVQGMGSSDDCYRAMFEWDITSIPDGTTILDTDFTFDVSAIIGNGADLCDYIGMNTQPTVGTNANLWTSISGDTVLVNADATCDTASDNTNIDLGATGDTYITNKLASDWAAVGVKRDSEVMDFTTRYSVILTEEEATATPKPTLTISYFVPVLMFVTVPTTTITTIGDIAQINGTIQVTNGTGAEQASIGNITSILTIVNGTTYNTNSTFQNSTSGVYGVNFGPIWYQMTTGSVYNFTIQASIQNQTKTISNTSITYTPREYGPDYFTADDPTQGTVNFTFVGDNTIHVNRNQSGSTFSIECLYITQSDAFFNNTDNGSWDNRTVTGYYSKNYAGFYYTICYNEGELFTTALEQNYTNQLVPGLVIFDELGGFVGAPSVILVIIAILSLATGRNFPIIIIIAVSVTGILGAMGLVTFTPAIWAALIITAGISLFGVRKFY